MTPEFIAIVAVGVAVVGLGADDTSDHAEAV